MRGRGIAIARYIVMRHSSDSEAFSAAEEEFFRAGDAMGEGEGAVDEEVATTPTRRAWSRWFSRTPRAATEPSIAENENS